MVRNNVVTRYEDNNGALLQVVIAHVSGQTLFSVPGSALMDTHCLPYPAGRTVIFPSQLPISVATALVGLPAYQAIGHPIFLKRAGVGDARVNETSMVGNALFIEFDRDITPAADETIRLPEGRLCIRYLSAIDAELIIIPPSKRAGAVTGT